MQPRHDEAKAAIDSAEPETGTERYKAKDYTYRVFWSEEDQEFVCVADEFKFLSNLADNQIDALAGMVDLLESVHNEIYDEGSTRPRRLLHPKGTLSLATLARTRAIQLAIRATILSPCEHEQARTVTMQAIVKRHHACTR